MANPYLLGYRNGCNDFSWSLSGPWKWVPDIPLPIGVKLSKADLKKHGLGEIESCDILYSI